MGISRSYSNPNFRRAAFSRWKSGPSAGARDGPHIHRGSARASSPRSSRTAPARPCARSRCVRGAGRGAARYIVSWFAGEWDKSSEVELPWLWPENRPTELTERRGLIWLMFQSFYHFIIRSKQRSRVRERIRRVVGTKDHIAISNHAKGIFLCGSDIAPAHPSGAADFLAFVHCFGGLDDVHNAPRKETSGFSQRRNCDPSPALECISVSSLPKHVLRFPHNSLETTACLS